MSSQFRQLWSPAVLCGALAMLGVGTLFAGESLQYNRDIRPILSDRCFKCHGPDKASRKASLRLDLAEEAYAERKKPGKYAIVPGKPEASLVCTKIFSTDADDVMPPPDSNLALTLKEKETIRRWISEGARYQPHWAFIPIPDATRVPAVKNARWSHNEIDRFILARLEKEGIQPSPEAARTRWLRRVTYDLTGLPPKAEEVDSFLADKSPTAYERIVDRLLASRFFGERMAVPWLDAARYADSYGYQSDQLCPTWPYRDWAVNAFNQNLPYDRFLTEQLAGDLLPNATRQQRLATAFNRLHRQTNEGGSIEEEWRTEYVSDRVHTFSTTVLALTFECAHCHDHKFDPIKQRDYYSLSAFFNSIDEYGLYNDSAHVPTPSLLLPNPEQEQAMTATERSLKEATDRFADAAGQAKTRFNDWLKDAKYNPEAPGLVHPAAAEESLRKDQALDSGGAPHAVHTLARDSIRNVMASSGLVADFNFDQIAGTNQFANALEATNLSTTLGANTLVPGHSGQAIKFDGDTAITFPKVAGSLQPWDQYTVLFWLKLPNGLTNAVIFHRSEGTDTGFHGTELKIENGRLFFVIKRFWPGNAIAVSSIDPIPFGNWIHLGVGYDGSARAEGMSLFLNGKPMRVEVVRNRLFKSPQNGGSGISFGALFRSTGLKDGLLDDLRVYNRPLSAIEVQQEFDGHSLEDAIAHRDADVLQPYYLSAVDDSFKQAQAQVSEAVKKYFEARNGVTETSVMEELAEPRPAYVLARGRYDALKTDDKRVQRATPVVLPVFPTNAPQNRLGLAMWLTDPHHPLTARVAVNRYWQMLFGRGIVTTTENFGAQGAEPTHPELLDWLARDFINSGWDVKAMMRKIVLSSTYRQDSKLRPDLQNRDPENLLLARGPSQRLPAEMIRDTALYASGLLDERAGGPSVGPYLPGDLWRESNSMSPAYHQSVGGDLYRRSLYTVWKRTAPAPDMTVFDAPSREVCSVKRNSTSTPQQAFVLLNDTQFVEAARVLAEKALEQTGLSTEQRIGFVFRRLTARDPDPREAKVLNELLREQAALFTKEPDRARKLMAVGDKKPDPALDVVQVAAMTALAQTVMNLDATVWKR